VGVARKVVKTDTPRFYGSSVYNNALYAQWKDSGGTARNIVGLDGSNLTKVGPQTAPPSGGDVVFYANGTEAGRFLPDGTLVLDGGLRVTDGPVDGYVLTSDASGNAVWEPPATSSTLSTLKWGSD
jgi:hypothetical protein